MSNITEIEIETVVTPLQSPSFVRKRFQQTWQIVRFSIVGVLNSCIDVAAMNVLLACFPTHSVYLMLVYSSIAYMLGALNSFVCNKYWTFREKKKATAGELLRFALVNVASLFLNGSIVWSVASVLHTLIANPLLWANIAKGTAIIGTSLLSYVGMRFWVFTQGARQGN